MTAAANPFAQLLGELPEREVKTPSQTLVVNGRRITDARQIAAALAGTGEHEPEDREETAHMAGLLRRKLERARNQARYQRQRQNPEAMAKRQAWVDANRDKVREYRAAWRARNLDLDRKYKAEYSARRYAADPERARQVSRDYYAAHREEILAKKRAETAAKRRGAAMPGERS